MKIFVIGCGSIGERHIKNLLSLNAGEISTFDTNKNQLKLIKEKYEIEIFEDIDEGLKQNPNLVFICTPSSLHLSLATKAIDYCSNLFIEKPISHNLEGLSDFIKKAEKNNVKIFIGYNLRFNKGISQLKTKITEGLIGDIFYARAEFGQYLPDWRPGVDYSKNYTARKDLGGGIILDASHEIDYITWMLGDTAEVTCFADKLSNLNVDVEDTADILLKFKNNSIASIHLDFIRRGYTRNCTIVGSTGTLSFDYVKAEIIHTTIEGKTQSFDCKTDPNYMYLEEMKHIINCIKNDEKPLIDVDEGKKVLKIAIAAKKSAKTGEKISL